jgi:hypothetical protein
MTATAGFPAMLQPQTDEAKRAVAFMFSRLERGLPVVVGSPAALEIGTPIARKDDKFLLVERRATREEFIASMPDEARAGQTPATAPFYWKLAASGPFRPPAATSDAAAGPGGIPARGAPGAPRYWMDEQSGVLSFAVRQYLENPRALTFGHIALLRLYLKQWVDSPAWDMNPALDDEGRQTLATLRRRADRIESANDVRAWLLVAQDIGMDPL